MAAHARHSVRIDRRAVVRIRIQVRVPDVAALAAIGSFYVVDVTCLAADPRGDPIMMPLADRSRVADAAVSRRLLDDGRVALLAGKAHRGGDLVMPRAALAQVARQAVLVVADIGVALGAVAGESRS